MIDRIIARLPEAWRGFAELIAAPIAWVPALQQMLLGFFLDPQPNWLAAMKYAFLLFPVLLGIVAIWCTGLGVYTLPFRSGRTRFVSLFLLAWWDAAIMVWMYWVGILRIALVAIGWVLSLARLTVRLVVGFIRDVMGAPFAMSSMLVRAYFRPGVPWLAFVALLFWCVLEAAVFAYTLHPRVAVLVADLAGADEISWLTAPILYLMVLALTMASFVCVQALVDAVRKRDNRFLAQIIFIETFAIFFEVTFLYRGLVEVTMPWIASDNVIAIVAAVGAWLGVRGLTWFFFGQYGTPPLLAFIARKPLVEPDMVHTNGLPSGAWWRLALDGVKHDIDWLHVKSEETLELLALPVIHLLGAALNFAMILTASRPVFNLPFRSLREVTETRDAHAAMHFDPHKQVSV